MLFLSGFLLQLQFTFIPCIQGGHPKKLQSIKQLLKIERPTHVINETLESDLIWSSPCVDIDNWSPSDRDRGHTFGVKP
jgi:serine/threonine-protein phosphatase PP1 catalytic subunit